MSNAPTIPEEFRLKGRSVISVQEAAKLLGISDRHVIDLIDEGKIRALDLGGQHGARRLYRIPVSAFQSFVASREC